MTTVLRTMAMLALASTLAAAPALAQHNHEQPAANAPAAKPSAAEEKPAQKQSHDHGGANAQGGGSGMHGMHKMHGKTERQGGDCGGASAERKRNDAVTLGMIATLEALTQVMKAMHAQSQN